MKKAIEAIEKWIGRWVPGIIAWPLGLVLVVLAFVLAALLMPPASFKKFCAEIDADIDSAESEETDAKD